MGALPRKRGPALGRDGHVQAASPRPMLGSERLHRGTRAPRDGATTEPTGHPPLGAKGLGSQAAGGRATRAPGWHRMSGARHSGPMGGPSRGGPTVHMAPGRPPLGLEAPAEQTPISGGPQAQEIATGTPATRSPPHPEARCRTAGPGPPVTPRLCPPRTAPAPARQTQRALCGGTCHLHPGATRRGRLGRGLGALFCAVSTAFKTKSVGTGLSVSGLSNEQGTFGENENLIFQLKP